MPNKGNIFFHKETMRTGFFCLPLVCFAKLQSLPSRRGLWVAVFPEGEAGLGSRAQAGRAAEDPACPSARGCCGRAPKRPGRWHPGAEGSVQVVLVLRQNGAGFDRHWFRRAPASHPTRLPPAGEWGTGFPAREGDVAERRPLPASAFAIGQLTETQFYAVLWLFSPQSCFGEQKKTSNLEAYVKWFNRLCYLVATEICMVSDKYVACLTLV